MNSENSVSAYPDWMLRLPSWMRSFMARRARRSAHRCLDRAVAERDRAAAKMMFADWIDPDTDEE